MMPSTSKKQRNFMAAIAHSPSFAKKVGVPQSVGKDFNEADKGRKFAKGGDTMAKKDSELDDDVATVKRALYKQPGDAALYSRERGLSPGMARRRLDDRGVDVRALVANEQNPDDLGNFKKGGKVKHEDVKMDKKMMQKAVNKHEGRLHKGSTMTKLASGGMAPSKMGAVKTSKKIDGIATKGKTKGTMVTMKNGGKC
jgi:hypothetical protein